MNRVIVKILNENDNLPVFEIKEKIMFISEVCHTSTHLFIVLMMLIKV